MREIQPFALSQSRRYNTRMRVSVICTVLNEKDAIVRLLDSLVAQTRPADEVVIVDGGSSDGTPAVVMSYAGRLPLKLQEARGANISRGRNLAVQRTTGEVIASTDAGVHLEPDWLQELISPFEALDDETLGSSAHAVAGFFVPDPQTSFELALGATTLPLARDVDPSRFLPSSRSVAFTRAAFDCSTGYPEWLDYCEDLIFDFRLIECCGGFAWAPEAVAHFRPRARLAQLLETILPLRTRRRQGRSLAQTPPNSLSDLPGCPACSAPSRHLPQSSVDASAARRHPRLLMATMSALAFPMARLFVAAADSIDLVDSRHPCHRRPGQDARLPRRPTLAPRSSQRAFDPMAPRA